MDEFVLEIKRRIITAGGLPLIVGGYVRDKAMGIKPKDTDIEVYRLSVEQIIRALDGFRLDVVGQSFGVVKVFIEDQDFDISVPRRESKCGVGHKGFQVQPDPNMTPQEAASRRDFTMNSLAETPEGEILYFFGGLQDIRDRVLRRTSSQFTEDPLRVLRAMQFAARFQMKMEPQTVALCQSISSEFSTLARERVYGEFVKLMMKGSAIGLGISLLKDVGWLAHFPALYALDGCPQDSIWHPEGDVLIHTQFVCDAAHAIAEREKLGEHERLILMFSALLHDVGKAHTTVKDELGRWTAPGHAEAGVEPARQFLESLGAPNFLTEAVLPLVREHMAHLSISVPTERFIRRLAVRLGVSSIEAWGRLVEADHSGRPPLPKGNPVIPFIEMARNLSVIDSAPKPILLGRHLIENFQMLPGLEMGSVLKAAYQVQLEEGWTDLETALTWVRSRAQI